MVWFGLFSQQPTTLPLTAQPREGTAYEPTARLVSVGSLASDAGGTPTVVWSRSRGDG